MKCEVVAVGHGAAPRPDRRHQLLVHRRAAGHGRDRLPPSDQGGRQPRSHGGGARAGARPQRRRDRLRWARSHAGRHHPRGDRGGHGSAARARPGDLVEKIQAMFGGRGREMPDNNLRQADVPQGASINPAMPGTAPGLICPFERGGESRVVYAVPGVPWEMQQMVQEGILPDLQQTGGDHVGHPEPHPAHLGPLGVGPRRAARRRDPSPRRDRRGDHRVSSPAVGKGSRSGSPRRRRPRTRWESCSTNTTRGSGPSSATSCSASTTTPWSRSCSTTCVGEGPHARPRRVGHRRADREVASPASPAAATSSGAPSFRTTVS